jgi:hypothetical protein
MDTLVIGLITAGAVVFALVCIFVLYLIFSIARKSQSKTNNNDKAANETFEHLREDEHLAEPPDEEGFRSRITQQNQGIRNSLPIPPSSPPRYKPYEPHQCAQLDGPPPRQGGQCGPTPRPPPRQEGQCGPTPRPPPRQVGPEKLQPRESGKQPGGADLVTNQDAPGSQRASRASGSARASRASGSARASRASGSARASRASGSARESNPKGSVRTSEVARVAEAARLATEEAARLATEEAARLVTEGAAILAAEEATILAAEEAARLAAEEAVNTVAQGLVNGIYAVISDSNGGLPVTDLIKNLMRNPKDINLKTTLQVTQVTLKALFDHAFEIAENPSLLPSSKTQVLLAAKGARNVFYDANFALLRAEYQINEQQIPLVKSDANKLQNIKQAYTRIEEQAAEALAKITEASNANPQNLHLSNTKVEFEYFKQNVTQAIKYVERLILDLQPALSPKRPSETVDNNPDGKPKRDFARNSAAVDGNQTLDFQRRIDLAKQIVDLVSTDVKQKDQLCSKRWVNFVKQNAGSGKSGFEFIQSVVDCLRSSPGQVKVAALVNLLKEPNVVNPERTLLQLALDIYKQNVHYDGHGIVCPAPQTTCV